MSEITSNETLQPSLLDRLADDEPSEKKESREKRVLSTKQLRMSVIRDLTWLLNASNREVMGDMELYPEVKDSVLNYGMPDLSGRVAIGMDIAQLEKLMIRIISFLSQELLKGLYQLKYLKQKVWIELQLVLI
jgi:type VI secretion system protein ImpF